MNNRLAALATLTSLSFAACKDGAKVDRLSTAVERMNREAEFRHKNTPNIYLLNDFKNQTIGVLNTSRTVSAGELVFIGEDIWQVDTVKLFTEELPKTGAPATPKGYKVTVIELLVTFKGKVQPRRPQASPPNKPAAEL